VVKLKNVKAALAKTLWGVKLDEAINRREFLRGLGAVAGVAATSHVAGKALGKATANTETSSATSNTSSSGTPEKKKNFFARLQDARGKGYKSGKSYNLMNREPLKMDPVIGIRGWTEHDKPVIKD